MSVYDYRDRPACDPYFYLNPTPYTNKNISKWWTPAHDKLIKDLIQKYQWHWFSEIDDEVIKITPKEITESLCKQYAWYNKVWKFALTRSKELGLTASIRKPEWKLCPLCNQKFVEDSLPFPLIKRLGIDHLDFCAPCLRDSVLRDTGDGWATREEIIDYLKKLTGIIQRVPPQKFGEGVDDLRDLNYQERLSLLKLLKFKKPTLDRIEEVFDSYFNALIEAEILENGARQTPRGIQTVAKDGHLCLSLGEKTIDDFLFNHQIEHQKEPRYPECNYRADFLIGEVFVEYFGFAGNPEYDARSKEKVNICKRHGITLISIHPKDLLSIERLSAKLLGVKPNF